MPGSATAAQAAGTVVGHREGNAMHPMFVKLFIETDADDLLAAEEDMRRRVRRSRRSRPAVVVKAAARDRDRPARPRP